MRGYVRPHPPTAVHCPGTVPVDLPRPEFGRGTQGEGGHEIGGGTCCIRVNFCAYIGQAPRRNVVRRTFRSFTRAARSTKPFGSPQAGSLGEALPAHIHRRDSMQPGQTGGPGDPLAARGSELDQASPKHPQAEGESGGVQGMRQPGEAASLLARPAGSPRDEQQRQLTGEGRP